MVAVSEWVVLGELPPTLGEKTGDEGGERLIDETAETTLVLRDIEGVDIGDTSWCEVD